MDDAREDDDRRYDSWRHRPARVPTRSYREFAERGSAAGGQWSTGRGIAATVGMPQEANWRDDAQGHDPTGEADDWGQTYRAPMRSYRGTPHRFRAERGPHSGRGPRGYRRADERIREDVCELLTQDGFVDAGDIEVDVTDGEVVLAGYVAGRNEKRRAEDLTDRVAGVLDVHNRLRVGSPR
jgi:hypothetical protein